MKASKECTTCRHHYLSAQDYPCSACGGANKLWESASMTITTYTGSIPKRDKQEKPKSLLKKYFLLWWEMTILIVQIYMKERELKPYPTLNKIKHQKYKDFRKIVKQWRLELNELKTELKELI